MDSRCSTNNREQPKNSLGCSCGNNNAKNENDSAVLKYLEWAKLLFSFFAIVLSYFKTFEGVIPFDMAWLAIIWCGYPIVKNSVIALVKEKRVNAELLITMGIVGSAAIGEFFAAAEVAYIMTLGEYLEEFTVRRSRAGISRLLSLSPQTARIRKDGQELIIEASELKVGDEVLVFAGETIPADGIIISGSASVDQSAITGESLPADKTVSDNVFEGTINQLGALTIKVTAAGEDSSLKKLIRMVEESEKNKPQIVKVADRWASYIVPTAIILSALVYIFTGELIRAITILVVFCPCSLVLATPTAIIAAVGRASKMGVLIKSGEVVERMAKTQAVCFDKTGTLTKGTLEVRHIEQVSDISEEDFLRLLSSAQKFSSHPLSGAVLEYAMEKGIKPSDPENFTVLAGLGIEAEVSAHKVCAGNLRFVTQTYPDTENTARKLLERAKDMGATCMLVAVDGKLSGGVYLTDTIREEAQGTLNQLKALKIDKTFLLSGDLEASAKSVGDALGISDIRHSLLPEDKVSAVNDIKSSGLNLMMIGDGINDAPALKSATTGVAMGAMGTDAAIEAADAALMGDDLAKIPQIIKLSKLTMKTIIFNIALSMGINFIAIFFAAWGLMGPAAGALVHNLGSVLVVLNSALLLKKKIKI